MKDCSRPSGLMTMDDALHRLLEAAVPVADKATLPLSMCAERVLAEPVASRVQVPPHDNSAMDGYALCLAELGTKRRLPLGPVVVAGAAPSILPPGHAARIFTGAPIPTGADTVVIQEQVELDGNSVLLPEKLELGKNIRRAGEDVREGAEVLTAGRRLRPQELGQAAAVGATSLTVYRRLKVALLCSGDELAEPGSELAPGQIYDSNGPTLSALLEGLGCDVLGPARLPDRLDATIDGLRAAAETADVVITSGGVSVGAEDHIRPAVEALGQLQLWQIAIKPGKPFAFGFIGDTPLLGLPGNPVSVFVTFLLLARPFLLKRQGRLDLQPPILNVRAGFHWSKPARGRREYLRARLAPAETGSVVEIYPHQGSGVLSSCVWADGLVRLEPGQSVAPGDLVPYLSLAELLA